MVIAAHVIFSAYGFWLPNDPRGSGSDFVASWEIFRYGKATKVHTRRSVARVAHDANLRRLAKSGLKLPPVRFTGIQARAIARGFVAAAKTGNYVFHACCILPEHVHLVLGRHERPTPLVVGHLKAAATRSLTDEGLHPFAEICPGNELPTPWGGRCWKVFLNTPEDVRRAIRYVENNPLKEGKPKQRWSFVTPFCS